MAQLGSALHWGCRGRRFKSCRSDHFKGGRSVLTRERGNAEENHEKKRLGLDFYYFNSANDIRPNNTVLIVAPNRFPTNAPPGVL